MWNERRLGWRSGNQGGPGALVAVGGPLALSIQPFCFRTAARPMRGCRAGLKRLGVTLTELVVTTAILVIVAAMIVPNMARLRDNALARDTVPSMQRLVAYARESAIGRGTTAVLTYDQSTTTLSVKQDTTVDPNSPTASALSAGQSAGSSQVVSTGNSAAVPMPTPPTVDPNNLAIDRSLAVPAGLELSDFQLAGQGVSGTDFQVRFYADGTCDSGGIGFTLDNSTQSLVIDNFGRATVVDGQLPDPSTERWQAGAFEPRQNAIP